MKSPSEIPHIKVLMYHRIVENGSENDASYYDVDVDNFRQQLKLIDSLNYTTITFKDYKLYEEGKLTLPRKPIILTFDDGHPDMIHTALPVLKEFNMKAVVFVLGDQSIKYAEWDDTTEEESTPLMTKEQILQLRNEGFEIGAHTMSHANLPELSMGELENEIVGSKEAVENLLGEQILSFAYPYGGTNKEVESMVAKAGFTYACGVYTGPPKFGENLHDIRRLAINYNVNYFKFLMRLITPYEYAEWLYGKVRNRNQSTEKTLQKANIRDYDFTTTNNF